MAGKKIMIIDDDKEFLEELQETLSLSGYYTIAINDSTTAVDTAYSMKPDIILLDLKMDGMSGFQVAEGLKKFPSTSQIPIIAMTGVFNKKNHFSLMDLCGMQMCLEKPFNPLDAIILIEEVFREQKKMRRNNQIYQ